MSPQSDLYSIGVILYECLTGRVPFDGQTPVAVTLQQLKEDPVPPSSYNRAVRPPSTRSCSGALSGNPTSATRRRKFHRRARRRRNRPRRAGEEQLVEVGLVVLAVLIGLLIAWAATRSHTVEVPDVVGTSSDAAVSS